MNLQNKRHDQFALFKFIMALYILGYHYNVLMGDISTAVNGTNFIIIKMWKLFQIGCWYGGTMPICFFAISGFVAYRAYYKRIINHELGCSEFLRRRMVRLYPLLFASILYMTFGQWIYFYKYREWWTGRNNDLWHVIQALTGVGVGTIMNIYDTVNGPIWYISILIVCYIVFWLCCDVVVRKNTIDYGIFIFVICLGLAIETWSISLPFLNGSCSTGYIGFFSGVICALILENERYVFVARKIACINLTLFTICFILFYKDFEIFAGDGYWMCFIIGIPMIILLDQTKIKQVVSNCVFDYLGRLSFPIYLLQLPTFCLFSTVFPSLLGYDYLFWIVFVLIVLESIGWVFMEKNIETCFKKMIESTMNLEKRK